MKGKVIGYWVTTVLISLGIGGPGVLDIMNGPDVAEIMKHLGYPSYFAPMIGVWKIIGVAAILAPGLPRVKEWAYAGIAFDLISASVSHGMAGDGAQNVAPPFLFLAVLTASWALRPQGRVLGQIMRGQSSAPASGAAPAM